MSSRPSCISTRSSCGSPTTPTSTPSRASHGPRRNCTSATSKGRAPSDGASAPAGPSATANDSAGDGEWLVGQGMADCAMGTFRFPSSAHVRLRADARAVIQSGTQDIGTGIVTILTQIVCDALGLEPGLVSCEIGDTDLPEAGPTFGSSSTMGVGAAVLAAAEDVLAKLREGYGLELRQAPGAGALSAAMSSAGSEELIGVGSFAPDDS